MRLMIASDIHGSAYYCRRMTEAFAVEKADRLLLVGDILYHGPRNDLPREYAPKQVIEMLNRMKDSIFCVRGNCDTEVDQMVLQFPILADYALIPMGDRLIYATHGHIFHKDNPPPMRRGDILLHGHTHVPANVTFGNGAFTYLNPGSISIPKEGSAHSYLMLEDGHFTWKELSE